MDENSLISCLLMIQIITVVLFKERDDMKKFINPVKEARSIRPNRCIFTPEEVAQFLMQIKELQGHNISLNEAEDGSVQFTIGDSVYSIMDIAPLV